MRAFLAVPRLDLAFAALSAALLAVLLVAAYGALVPFFAALAATPVALGLLGLGAYTPARRP